MSAIKRLSIVLLIILFMLSIINDLEKNPSLQTEETIVKQDIGIAHIKVNYGDTVLSITEEINEMEMLDIEKIVSDFENLNPGVDSQFLIPNEFYYFPLYNEH